MMIHTVAQCRISFMSSRLAASLSLSMLDDAVDDGYIRGIENAVDDVQAVAWNTLPRMRTLWYEQCRR